jgi:hypothetical protein
MRFAHLRIGLAIIGASLLGSCQPPSGIQRSATLDGSIDVSCVERGVRATPGLTDIQAESYRDRPDVNPTAEEFNWISVGYEAHEIRSALDSGNMGVRVAHFGEPTQFTISHGFYRNSDKHVSRAQVQTAVDTMKRIESNIALACGIDLLPAMQMECGPSLYRCKGIA